MAELRERTGAQPGLATVLVGDDPASAVYVASKRKACAEVGITDLHQHLPADATQADVAAVIERAATRTPRSAGSCCSFPSRPGSTARS